MLYKYYHASCSQEYFSTWSGPMPETTLQVISTSIDVNVRYIMDKSFIKLQTELRKLEEEFAETKMPSKYCDLLDAIISKRKEIAAALRDNPKKET